MSSYSAELGSQGKRSGGETSSVKPKSSENYMPKSEQAEKPSVSTNKAADSADQSAGSLRVKLDARESMSVLDRPGYEGKVQGEVQNGQEVQLLEKDGVWSHIKWDGGEGWILGSALSGEQAQDDDEKPRPAVSASGVPLYNQSDNRWGPRILGKLYTIRQKGCAVTSTAMALSKIGGTEIDPAQMDEFLDNHEGYDDQDRLYWQIAASKIGHTATFYNGYIARHRTVVDDELDAGRPVALSTDGNRHWVCVAGRNADGTYIIHDPNGGKVVSAKWNAAKKGFLVDGYTYGDRIRSF